MMRISYKKLIITAVCSAAISTSIFPHAAFAEEKIEQITKHLKAGDFSVVKAELIPLAKNGNARAEYNLGISYLYGHGVEQNSAEAFNWILKAAGQADTHAEVNVASMYLQGRGVAKNFPDAMSWYQKAADEGDVNADIELGKIYRDGIGAKVDYKKSFEYFSAAGKLGSAEAKYNLAAYYHYGLGVDKDENKARALFSNVTEDNKKSTVASFGNSSVTN